MSPTWDLEFEEGASAASRSLWLHDELFALRMDYVPELIARLKALRHRAYVPNRHWWLIQPVPEAVHGLRQIVDEFGFSGTDEALHHLDRLANLYRDIQLDRRLSSVGRYIYRSPRGDILFAFPMDLIIADNIRDFTGGFWDKRVCAFRVPAEKQSGDAILALVDEFDFFIEPALYERLVNEQLPIFDDEEFSCEPLGSLDKTLFWMLIRFSEQRRDLLFDAVLNYRRY